MTLDDLFIHSNIRNNYQCKGTFFKFSKLSATELHKSPHIQENLSW